MGLHEDERRRPRDVDLASGALSGDGHVVDLDPNHIAERQRKRRGHDGREVRLQVLERASTLTDGQGRNEEVERDVSPALPPGLPRGSARIVRGLLKATRTQSVPDLAVSLLIEHGDVEPKIKVSRTDVALILLHLVLVYNQVGHEPTHDDNLVEEIT